MKPTDAINVEIEQIQKGRASRETQSAEKAKTAHTMTKRRAISAQKAGSFQEGGYVPSGLLQPPGKSSSMVRTSPTAGQTMKNNKAVGPAGQLKKMQTTAVSAELTAKPKTGTKMRFSKLVH